MAYGGNQPPGYGQPGGYGAPPGGQPQTGYASMGKRLVAVILDGIIVNVATIPGWIVFGIATAGAVSSADPSGRISNEAASAFGGMMLLAIAVIGLGALIVGLYNIYLLGRDGATLGKRWMKIKVLDPNGQPLGFGKAFLREIVKGALGGFCFLLYLWPLFDNQRQGLWDKMFGTHVLEG